MWELKDKGELVMKKILSVILSAAVVLTVSAAVYAREFELHDGVYRGEKWERDFGQPRKDRYIIIGPDEEGKTRVYGEEIIEEEKKPYKLVPLGNGE